MSDIDTTLTRLPVITDEMLAEQSQHIDRTLSQIHVSIERLIAERDALRAVLTEIVREFRATYEASNDGGTWKGAAQIDARLMQRAERLVSK